MSLPQLSENGHAYHNVSTLNNSTLHMKYKIERSPNNTLLHTLGSRAVTTDDTTSNTNQINNSTSYAYVSLPHPPTKCRARIRAMQNAPEPLIDKPITKDQQCPPSSYPYNKSSTLPRPHRVKLNMEKREDKKVSCFEMKEPFLSWYFY